MEIYFKRLGTLSDAKAKYVDLQERIHRAHQGFSDENIKNLKQRLRYQKNKIEKMQGFVDERT